MRLETEKMRAVAIALTAFAALLQSELVAAHTYIWGVFVNGVDQGTGRGIRSPAYNGAPPNGYANSPVKDLDSIDMRCNVLGDKQNPVTIQVEPGDNLTFDWHHDKRTPVTTIDDVIASSHHGPAMIYISPDPPTDNSFVKIWEEGKFAQGATALAAGKWATTADIASNAGHMNMRIPAGLKAGHYLIRAELVGLHEADASWKVNSARGAQFYPNCIQIEVVGNGTVALPSGVSFPGAYKYTDPGVVYDIYCSTKTTTTAPCTTTYVIPGPTVWSGAWTDTTPVAVGPTSGDLSVTRWSTWIQRSVVSLATFSANKATVTSTSSYVASWSTTYAEPTATA